LSSEPKLSLVDSPRLFEQANSFADAVVAPLRSILDNFHSFTDRLRQSDELLASYNALKRSFSGADMEIYRKAKSDFIARNLVEAKR
jgi:GrpB-like predicted nucleotidyltransferase (UPF0157 family)